MAWLLEYGDGGVHNGWELFEKASLLHTVVQVDQEKIDSIFLGGQTTHGYQGQYGVVIGGGWTQAAYDDKGPIYRLHNVSVCFPFWDDFHGHPGVRSELRSPIYKTDKCWNIFTENLYRIPSATDSLRDAYSCYLDDDDLHMFMYKARCILQKTDELSCSSANFTIP